MARNLTDHIEKLTSIGISLSSERNLPVLLEKILLGAKDITNADGGTLYLIKDKQLHFEILRTDSLGFAMGGTSGEDIPFQPIPLYIEHELMNHKNVSAFAAVTGQTVNIPDAYTAEGFDFQGMKNFDKKNAYRSTSFLTVPLKNHENEYIGVLQLINAQEEATGKIIPFSEAHQKLAESLASQAAIALSNFQLIEDLRNLLEKFIEVIASAIDEKSPYTGGHCRRVPAVANLLGQAVNDIKYGPLANIELTSEQLYELNIAALLHDCGKITTPVHVVDKATKLEAIFDRIDLVKQRILNIRKDEKIKLLETLLEEKNPTIIEKAQAHYRERLKQLDDDLSFLETANRGAEFMDEEHKERVLKIAKEHWLDENDNLQVLLNENEIYNLSVNRGTLTQEERDIINNHIVVTQKMLTALPFPKHLSNVAEIAGNHHERMDGKGYPNGIKGEDMSIQARIMCIADIFEALTAADRPYKKAMPLSVALNILNKMKDDQHIDADLFDCFIQNGVFLKYANEFLAPEQIDVDIDGTKEKFKNKLTG